MRGELDLTTVLLELRLVGFAPAEQIASRPALAGAAGAGAGAGAVRAVLLAAQDAGLVTERGGRFPGWMLSTAGRARVEERLAAELEGARSRSAVEAAYEAFRPVNVELLEVCTRWQVRTDHRGAEVPNRHDDPENDRLAVDELASLHERAVALLADLAEAAPRFEGYAERLGHALERVRAGEPDWFTRPTLDSYHTVWFELHEHLLATLGRTRAGEQP